MKNISIRLIVLLIFVITFSNTVMAQLPPGFGDTSVDDTTPAPISGLLAFGIIVGAVIGYRKLK